MRLSTWTAVSAFLAGAIVASPRLGFADIMYVDAGAPPGGDGASWETAFVHLQDALNVATNGAQIWVAEGAYTPDQGGGQTAGDRDATFQLRNQIALYGGFAGNEITLEQRDVGTHHTVLSGDLAGDDALMACVEDTPADPRCVFVHGERSQRARIADR